MPNEAELRLHRCCFAGHRPEKLSADEGEVKAWLATQIHAAIDAGCVTFITGMGMGVDIWAGQAVVRLRGQDPRLHLIAAPPYPGFERRWSMDWQSRYRDLLRAADLVRPVSERYAPDALVRRGEWMVAHSSRLIAYYNGDPGSTRDTVELARRSGLEVTVGGLISSADSFVAYDFETTGLDREKDSIIEFGAVKVINGQEVETFQEFVRPDGGIVSARITELTGITTADVCLARSPEEVVTDFARFVGDLPLLGYNNIGFDSAFLLRAARRAGLTFASQQLDAMLYSARFRTKLGFSRSHVRLGVLAERLNIVNPRAHRALADAMTTARVYLALRELEKEL